jgi:hypothetical protein
MKAELELRRRVHRQTRDGYKIAIKLARKPWRRVRIASGSGKAAFARVDSASRHRAKPNFSIEAGVSAVNVPRGGAKYR